MTVLNHRFKHHFLIIIHGILIAAAYTSPLWLPWKLVIAGVFIYWLQLLLFQHCVLSTAQFGDKETTFHEWYLTKIGIRPNHHKLKEMLNMWIPLAIICVSIILQVWLNVRSLVGG